ncbi:MAG: sensor histidine kinase [Dehalococcoidia bacterium]
MESVSRFLRGLDPRVLDAVVAIALSLGAVAIVAGRDGGGGDLRSDDVLGLVLALAQTLPLAVRRNHPLGVAFAISIALVAHSAIGYEVVQAGTFSSLVAVYGAGTLCDRRGSLLTLGITFAAIAGFYATNREDWATGDIVATTGTWVAAWLLGVFVRIRGQQADAAGARVASLELEQEMRAREAVADERARMARELHDIVGHALNIIVLQASGAQRVFDTRPEVSRETLSSIESTGREALADMERMLGVLRDADLENQRSEPQPGLAQLEGLAAHVSEAGIPVEVVIEGEPVDVPASVDLSAYRIVQESLTNCLKHSGASHATVTVRYSPHDVEVTVVDNGRGRTNGASSTGGRGHLGMRERAGLFGGEISMGPVEKSQGYAVKARLPFKGPPQ